MVKRKSPTWGGPRHGPNKKESTELELKTKNPGKDGGPTKHLVELQKRNPEKLLSSPGGQRGKGGKMLRDQKRTAKV